MANLDAAADKAVHDAVDAFMEGRLNPEFAGETVFETKNSRYRLLDGVVFSAPSESLVGAELVGWLMETSQRSVVGSAWQPGARAVLVDRNRGRNIIVTSTTRILHLEERAPNEPRVTMGHRPSQVGGYPQAPGALPPSPWGPQAALLPRPSPLPPPPAEPTVRARILPSTPPPPMVLPQPLPAAIALRPRGPVYGGAASDLTPHPPPPASPVQSAAVVQKRAAAVHLPPRPITPTPIPVPSRPLPLPVPPPARSPPWGPAPTSSPPRAASPPGPRQPAQVPGTPWELTSSEFEIDTENELTRPDNAPHHPSFDSADIPTNILQAGESSADPPIPLVRTVDTGMPAPSPRAPPRPRR